MEALFSFGCGEEILSFSLALARSSSPRAQRLWRFWGGISVASAESSARETITSWALMMLVKSLQQKPLHATSSECEPL